jgi:hypothetical protein
VHSRGKKNILQRKNLKEFFAWDKAKPTYFAGYKDLFIYDHLATIDKIMCITTTCVFMTLAAILMVQIQPSRSSLNTSSKDNIEFPQKSPKLNTTKSEQDIGLSN